MGFLAAARHQRRSGRSWRTRAHVIKGEKKIGKLEKRRRKGDEKRRKNGKGRFGLSPHLPAARHRPRASARTEQGTERRSGTATRTSAKRKRKKIETRTARKKNQRRRIAIGRRRKTSTR